ncbi:hypothetical protein LPJ58_004161 [Coemansia sp. RSA 1591]|nr:hypothetical protein LPJ58_004161 [Coemansia sp. RSA 1591]
MRMYGASGIRAHIRKHVKEAKWLEAQLVEDGRFEIMAPVVFGLVVFRVKASIIAGNAHDVNKTNAELVKRINNDGRVFLVGTKLRGVDALRPAIGSSRGTPENTALLLKVIKECTTNQTAAPEAQSMSMLLALQSAKNEDYIPPVITPSNNSALQSLVIGDSSVVTMLYDFDGDGSSTLTAKTGDKVRVIEPEIDASGWTEVQLVNSGLQGMVPTSYMDMSEYKPASHAPSTYSASTASPLSKPAVEYAMALYDFESRRPEELSCKQGDHVQIVSRDANDGWIMCKLDGREGLLPANYVENAS